MLLDLFVDQPGGFQFVELLHSLPEAFLRELFDLGFVELVSLQGL